MSSNAKGSYRTTRELMMAAFDRLPPDVRAALRDAVGNWVPQKLQTLRKRGWDDHLLCKLVRDWNCSELHRREQERRAARGVYAGNVPDPDYVPQKRRGRTRR